MLADLIELNIAPPPDRPRIELKRGLVLVYVNAALVDDPQGWEYATVMAQCVREDAPVYGKWSIAFGNGNCWYTEDDINEDFVLPGEAHLPIPANL